MKRQRILIVAVIAAVALATGGWLLQRQAEPVGSVYQQARLFDDVLARVADAYVDSIDERQLYEMAIDGLLDQLHDPYSVYLKPEDFRSLTEQTSGNYGGLGIQIEVRNGWITVVAPLPDTPAERAGVQTGDLIVSLDGRSTEGWKQDEAVKQLRGEPGVAAELLIRRTGVDQPLRFSITRALIHVRSVQIAMMLDDRVGYISLSPVSETSARELQQALDSLTKQGMKSLIFDLRGNPGGLLDEGIAVSDLFLDPGQEIVATRGRMPNSTRTYRDGAAQTWPRLPIVVMVNEGSASAAEIIAGALQDHDRGVVLGTPTFGKGLVQSFWRLTPTTGLKLTTARWFTPSGRTIQRKTRGEADQEAQVIAAAQGKDTAQADSALRFHTDAGRLIFGGGGIRPDLFVRADTLTAGERDFARALGAQAQVYRDVLVNYALEQKARNALDSPKFRVSDAMVDEIVRRLRAKNVTLPDSIVAGARTLIRQQVGYEVARYVYGRPAEFLRRMGDDTQIQRALSLADRARTPQDLLSMTTTQAPTNRN